MNSCRALRGVIGTNTTLTHLKVGDLDHEVDFDHERWINKIEKGLKYNGTLLSFEFEHVLDQPFGLIDRNRNNHIQRTQTLTHKLLTLVTA